MTNSKSFWETRKTWKFEVFSDREFQTEETWEIQSLFKQGRLENLEYFQTAIIPDRENLKNSKSFQTGNWLPDLRTYPALKKNWVWGMSFGGGGLLYISKNFIPPRSHQNFITYATLWMKMYCRSEMDQKCILRLKTPSRDPQNISTYLQDHLRPPRSSLKNHEKSHFLVVFPYKGPKG